MPHPQPRRLPPEFTNEDFNAFVKAILPIVGDENLSIVWADVELQDGDYLGRDNHTILLGVFDQLLVELRQRHDHPLDVLSVVQALLRLRLILLELDLDHDHLHAGVGHAGIGRLRRADAEDLALVARLLLELADGGLLGRLVGVDEASGPFDGVGVEGRPVLDDEHGGGRLGRVEEDVAHGDGVDAGLARRLARGDLPGARLADLIDVVDLFQRHPAGVSRGEVRDLGDDGLLRFL
ncbi:hypothetical protein BN1708_012060 [Verticillium longisporum]|uniref:Uncharacterized protein n=1 Tax=Verticillium longisporum TaxID=100787 RepID=A0A0G4L666_VERLO|nr:hypothetical protein BN1708_012060 [Verticillium longisporum]